MKSLDSNKATPKNDVSAKVMKRFADQLCEPITMLINEAIIEGNWPQFLKNETVTPVPKVKSPQSTDDLRKISGLMNLNKIMEKLVLKYLVDDMKKNIDKSQFANQKGQSINHYLVLRV